MGVPAFFRWLTRKYPSVIVYAVEEKPKYVDGVKIPVDSSSPNPNGVEFDNLYLDMNGIIHPCTHPEDRPAPKDEDEMMIAIFECIDRLFSIVRPRKLLYMAVDGVAPRAKMNQQRSRRFRAAKESVEKIEEIDRLRSELSSKGAYLPPEKPKETHFDTNCITPGTPFMDRLSTCLNYYIHDRLNNDPGWRGIKVVLSDANVPGEGEHKIMDYIRKQRAQPDHDPNTQHCLCGADADLIMLGLATHEPNFTIIREEFRPNKPKPCDICQQLGHEMKDCVGCPKPIDGASEPPTFGDEVPFIFVRLNVLREYLERELSMPNLPFRYDFERAVDDWVFMCFFVGNDFLPHLPSLEIREGAIDRLVNLYKSCVYRTGGFVTDSGDVNLGRVQLILNELGKAEDEIFKKRQQTEKMFKQRDKARKKMASEGSNGRPAWIPSGQFAPTPLGFKPSSSPSSVSPITRPREAIYKERIQSIHATSTRDYNTQSSKMQKEDRGVKRRLTEGGNSPDSDDDEETHDEVRLWEDGFKDRYYESKFDVNKNNIEFRIKVAHEYVKGLCWVLRYYYQGCASWKWYFPYHYAPFASDFVNISGLSTTFEKGTRPFNPLEQLMGVFPAASSSHVPKPWARLMEDPSSPIIDFYPIDFKIDLNGKKFAWQGVALLPFVDENRLLKALAPFYNHLTSAEKKRNIRGDDKVYVGLGNKGHAFLKGIYANSVINDEEIDFCVDGMRGKVLLSNDCVGEDGILLSPVRSLPKIEENVVLCARFRDPTYSCDFIFKAKRLKGAIEPERVLKPENLTYEQNRNWRPQTGMVPDSRNISLSIAGHRMVDHYSGNRNLGGIYSQVPPPQPAFPQSNRFQPYRNQQSYGYSTLPNNNYGRQERVENRDNRRFPPQQHQQSQGSNFRRYGGYQDQRSSDQQYHGSDNRSGNHRGRSFNQRPGSRFNSQDFGTRNQNNYYDRYNSKN